MSDGGLARDLRAGVVVEALRLGEDDVEPGE
jgi:hypothetical protein